MAIKKKKSAPSVPYSHSSFAFKNEDIDLLKYCAEKTGLSQSELIRRLIRVLASGAKLPNMIEIPAHPIAKKWLKEVDA